MNTAACPIGPPRIAIIGVGNDFRHDDGVGWAVVTALAEWAGRHPLPSGTALRECDGEPARLISLWENTDLAIVIDSARAEAARPGRVHRLELDNDKMAQDGAATSSHGLGLGDAVELARHLDRLPHRLIIYAIEGADSSLGVGLSAPVSAVVRPLAERIANEIPRYTQSST